MATLTLGHRQSIADSFDENQSRYIPSSVYSGPGPDFEGRRSAQPVQPVQPVHPMYSTNGISHGGQNGYRGANGSSLPFTPQSRGSVALNTNDPVAIHLLTETALGDSRNYEILSFQELEQLKVEKGRLRNKIQTTKRKIALESKLRDAAQSLNRLYTKSGRDATDPKGHQRNLTGSSKASDLSSRAEDEFTASNRKLEELTVLLESLKERLDDTQRRILEHTAGILQMTHRGLKKNLRKNELPRSPESMASPGQRSISGGPVLDDFDERSFYPIPDYVNDFLGASPMTPMLLSSSKNSQNGQPSKDMASKLQELSKRLHGMAQQMQSNDHAEQPPNFSEFKSPRDISSAIDAHFDFLSKSLDSLATAQQRSFEESTNATTRIYDMLERTQSMGKSPALVQGQTGDAGLASQLAFSTKTLEQLSARVESLIEQKDILTRQIQQQRELNSKSDSERDSHIQALTAELEELRTKHADNDHESRQAQAEISQLMDQLDRAREDNRLLEQQRGLDDNKALSTEREARKRAEDELETRLQQHNIKMNEQRAAEATSNAAAQKQLSELQALNGQLQKELKDTIEDYEQLTKASIEFEKERDVFEASIDKLRDKCETLESQLNEEKLKSLGTKAPTNENTSTTVLKNEFKKMMRDTKTESMKAIRHEQEERRRLEMIIRQLKKEMGTSTPSKSGTTT